MHSAALNITSISYVSIFFFFFFFTISDSYILYLLATYLCCGSEVVVLTGLTFCSYHDIANDFFCFNNSGMM